MLARGGPRSLPNTTNGTHPRRNCSVANLCRLFTLHRHWNYPTSSFITLRLGVNNYTSWLISFYLYYSTICGYQCDNHVSDIAVKNAIMVRWIRATLALFGDAWHSDVSYRQNTLISILKKGVSCGNYNLSESSAPKSDNATRLTSTQLPDCITRYYEKRRISSSSWGNSAWHKH